MNSDASENSQSSISDNDQGQAKDLSAVVRLMDEFRNYLMTIAAAELPGEIQGKIGASDLVQETLLQGLKDYGEFNGTTREQLGKWLKAILIHKLQNVIRSCHAQKRDVGLELDGQTLFDRSLETASKEVQAREESLILEAALSRLSPEQRELILLRHHGDLTFAEIGIRTGRTEDSARKAWGRAIEQLKKELRLNGFGSG